MSIRLGRSCTTVHTAFHCRILHKRLPVSRHLCRTALICALVGCSGSNATAPTTPAAPSNSKPSTPANVAGTWADTTDSAGDGASLVLTQRDDSLLSGTENDYLRVGSPGSTWWTRVAAPGSVNGTVRGDTVMLVVNYGASMPLQYDTVIARGSDTLAWLPSDSMYSYGSHYVRGAWAPDTTAPQGASSPTVADLTGLWVSDSIAWFGTPAGCTGAIQSAITVSRADPDDSTVYEGNTYDRICGSDPGTPWTYEVSNYGQLVPGDCLSGNFNCGHTGIRCMSKRHRVHAVVSGDCTRRVPTRRRQFGARLARRYVVEHDARQPQRGAARHAIRAHGIGARAAERERGDAANGTHAEATMSETPKERAEWERIGRTLLPVKHATTPEEWERQIAAENDAEATARHAAAALAIINGQGGFTWDDVAILRSIAHSRPDGTYEQETLTSLADRIAALLPPRHSTP